MRLWTLHPRYLDGKGLVALWREGLLAQKTLTGDTKGYRNHPQLERFRAHRSPERAIADYLHAICDESEKRGYRFDRNRVALPVSNAPQIEATDGQLRYELAHLARKLAVRAPKDCWRLNELDVPETHPLFVIVAGPVAIWERTK